MTAQTTAPPAILLTHGFWHGAWCWTEVTARLTGAGRRVLAVDLAGHGLLARRPASASARPFDEAAFAAEVSPVASVDLDAAAELLVGQVRDLAIEGPVVLVAHSFGGAVVTRAAQTAPELVRHLVYVAACMPASGVPAVSYLHEPEQHGDRVAPLLRGDPGATGVLRLDVGAGGDYRAAVRQAFYSDVDPDVADAAATLLTPDAPVGIATGATVLSEDAWGSIPRTYVVCAFDDSFRPALQRRWVLEADAAFPQNPTTVVELRSAHSPFLSMPGPLADLIAEAQ